MALKDLLQVVSLSTIALDCERSLLSPEGLLAVYILQQMVVNQQLSKFFYVVVFTNVNVLAPKSVDSDHQTNSVRPDGGFIY